MTKAFITGVCSLRLTDDERRFFQQEKPWGLILFARNIESREQIKSLIADFRGCVDAQATVLIDQEGGRVQRLRPPLAPNYPSGAALGRVYAQNPQNGTRAAWLAGYLIGSDLHALDITVDCDPVLDIPTPGAHDVIGDRAYGHDAPTVIALARAKMNGLMDAGVLPVIKHMPGHGRAEADSHHNLPQVSATYAELSATDFAPFKALRDAPFGMSAHIVYTALDASGPGTLSARVVGEIIRKDIGFDGALMSDDVGMKALTGSFADRARASITAGCDLVCHCSGNLEEMRAVASGTPVLAGEALRRCKTALARQAAPKTYDTVALSLELQALLRDAGAPVLEALVA